MHQKDFNIQQWIATMEVQELDKFIAVIQNQGKTGDISKTLKPHMQFVKNFVALKDYS